ncbi:tautomerase family protein [uncultured Litoreibacter sp.]|uniref:tautomerase family protein n=1 Tax=uncultured Litoreibacter sp. TaxID=1392394 RepID=UPI002622D9E9|nr:tautomerase family protein [uncultured Litoreibacter sp.]
MPFVTIRLVKQVIEHDPEGIKAKINDAVTHGISEAAGIPKENVWLVFDEIEETDWFSGGERVKELRSSS